MSARGSKNYVDSKRVTNGNLAANSVGNIQAQLMAKYKLPGSKSSSIIQHSSSQAKDYKSDSKQSNTVVTNLNKIIYCVVCGSSNNAFTQQQINGLDSKMLNTAACDSCSSYLYEDQVLSKDPKTSSSSSSMSSYKLLFNWKDIEQKMIIRQEVNCPICMMPFRLMKETLLSCSHIFHTPCLRSFEKFTLKNNDHRFCPLCRESNYYAKNTNLGSQIYHATCIIKIQCLYRGYIARKEYYFLLKHLYQSGHGKETKNRRKFYERELIHQTNRMTHQVDAARSEVDDLISCTDHTMNESKSLDDAFTQMLLNRAATANNNTSVVAGSGNTSNYASSYNRDDKRPDDDDDVNDSVHLNDGLPIQQWKEILKVAVDRGICECAICMTTITTAMVATSIAKMSVADKAAPLTVKKVTKSNMSVGKATHVAINGTVVSSNNRMGHSCTSHADSKSVQQKQPKPQPQPLTQTSSTITMRSIVLLSCTHIFHQQCIQNLEAFAHYTTLMTSTSTASNNDGADTKTDDLRSSSCCPICRSFYSKRILHYQQDIESYTLS